MKRLDNNRMTGNASSEKTLMQGRLANMRKLNLRRLFSLAGMAVLLIGVAFVAYGETTGTDRADVFTIATAGEEVFTFGGDDTINITAGDVEAFAGAGDDTITTSTATGGGILFGEDGSDTFRLAGTGVTTASGGRGDDFFNITGAIPVNSEIKDGPGQDTIIDNTATALGYAIMLVADNEQDTVLLDSDGANGQTIRLAKGSGRDVIQCDGGGDVVFLNGNRKAVDTKGNNLRKAALLGGTAESGCDTIIP